MNLDQTLLWDKLNRRLARNLSNDENSPYFSLVKEIEKLENLADESEIGDLEELSKIIVEVADSASRVRAIFSDIGRYLEAQESGRLPLYLSIGLEGVEHFLTELEEGSRDKTPEDIVASGIKYKILGNLIRNFQIPEISHLAGMEKTRSEVAIEGIGNIQFSNEEIDSSIWNVGLEHLQQYSRVIYLESPVYWKLKNALETLRIRPRYFPSLRERIDGIPGYFYDLASALKSEYTGDIAFPGLYEKLTGKDVLGGKIAISGGGDLSFQENGRRFSLPITAMGVANLGILALLIEHKVLDEDSFLFIDEPEAHLHPAWQVIMAETLFELAKGGVHVVIATHSADILKWLEVHVKKNPDDENLIALNKFPATGDEAEDQDFVDKIASIKQELTKPFADLYMAGL